MSGRRAENEREATLKPCRELDEYYSDKSDEFIRRSQGHMKHGVAEKWPRLYSIWASMRTRCNNPNRHNYCRYGGRGIRVCAAWDSDAGKFAEWALANGYAEGLQLDRIDNDGPYSPENCRWVTPKENARNTRRNKCLTLCGLTKTVAEWCETLDISEFTVYWWLREYGEKGCEKRVYERLASAL